MIQSWYGRRPLHGIHDAGGGAYPLGRRPSAATDATSPEEMQRVSRCYGRATRAYPDPTADPPPAVIVVGGVEVPAFFGAFLDRQRGRVAARPGVRS